MRGYLWLIPAAISLLNWSHMPLIYSFPHTHLLISAGSEEAVFANCCHWKLGELGVWSLMSKMKMESRRKRETWRMVFNSSFLYIYIVWGNYSYLHLEHITYICLIANYCCVPLLRLSLFIYYWEKKLHFPRIQQLWMGSWYSGGQFHCCYKIPRTAA